MQKFNFINMTLFVSLMLVSTQPYAELSTSSAPPQSSQSISTSMPGSSPSSSPVNSTTAPGAGMTNTTTTTNTTSNVNTGPTAGTTNSPTTSTTVQSTGAPSSGVNPVTDQNINAAFQAQISTSSDLRTQSINASTQNGIVTLNGTVDTQAQADRAVSIAKSISGVNGVQSNLTVRNP